MTTSPQRPHQEERLLARFIRQVDERSDTPSLIMIIAADTDYLRLCHLIVNPAIELSPNFSIALKTVCRDHGWRLSRLQAKLTPAASALGIIPSSHAAADYYRLLGINAQADVREIKMAFRRKAVKFHPDANANLTGSSQEFVELNDAYRTLRDPLLRHHYDTSRQRPLLWHEGTGLSLRSDRRPVFLLWYLIGLFLIFMLLFLFLDRIVSQNHSTTQPVISFLNSGQDFKSG